MAIKLGSTNFSHVYLGSTKIGEAYLGNVKVFQEAPAGAVIGGKTYPTVTLPDGREWLALNLDYAWSGLSVPTSGASGSTSPQAMYYNYDESTYGWNGLKRGLLYNHYAVSYLISHQSTLCPGWHVPTKAEFDALQTALGGYLYGYTLKSTTGWKNDGNGTDSYGFAGYPSGEWSGGAFSSFDEKLMLWVSTFSDNNANYFYLNYSSTSLSNTTALRKHQKSVRLIKNI